MTTLADNLARDALAPYAGRALLAVEECAAILGLGRSAAYEAVRRGEIPSLRIGRRVLVPLPALAATLTQETRP